MTAASDQRSSVYRPELDAVRFIAFVLVFLHHFFSPANLWFLGSREQVVQRYGPGFAQVLTSARNAAGFGLCLFFALSAYLICDLLQRERNRIGTVRIGAFYRRRILRIWPLYCLGLLIGSAFAIRHHDHRGSMMFVAYAFMVGNWYCGRLAAWVSNPMLPLWSISIEEQFYLFWPMIARSWSRRATYVACISMILVSNAWLIYYGSVGAYAEPRVWTNSFIQFETFAAGLLMAMVLRQRMPSISLTARTALFIVSFAGWFMADYALHLETIDAQPSIGQFILGYALVSSSAAALILSLLGVPKGTIPTWLSYLGRISFGLYVFHELAGDILYSLHVTLRLPSPITMVLQMLLTIGIAALSYRFLESPFLRMKARSEIILTNPQS